MQIADMETAFQMRLRGKGWPEIAKEIGCKPNTVYLALLNMVKHGKTLKSCIYPNIRDYILENDGTIASFAEECGITYPTMYQTLAGRNKMSDYILGAIMDATGMLAADVLKRSDPNGMDENPGTDS